MKNLVSTLGLLCRYFASLLLSLFFAGNNSVNGQELEVVVDPEAHHMLWSSYNNSTGFDKSEGIVADIAGNVYSVGFLPSTSLSNWPLLNIFHGGGYDAYLNKMDRNGQIQWSLFIGGEGNDFAAAVALTPEGNIVVAGNTNSEENITINNSESAFGGGTNDCFLTTVSPTGEIIWSRYFGGSGGDYINDLHITHDGRILICGKTASTSSTYSSTIQSDFAGGLSDGFMASIDGEGQFEWFTLLGGASQDEIKDIDFDENGQIIFCGYGSSVSIIDATSPTPGGGGTGDAFIGTVDTSGQLLWARYEGGASFDNLEAIEVTASGNIIATGYSSSAPISGFNISGTPQDGDQNVYVISYSPSGTINWGTYYGGSGQETVSDIHIDLFGNIYIAGETSSTDLSVGEAFQIINRGGFDNFITKWNEEGAMLWSSYSGGTDDDFSNSLTSDRMGKVYMTGHTFSADLGSTLPGNGYAQMSEGYIIKFSDCNNPDVTIHTPDDSTFCEGSSATLIACGAQHYDWVTGDTTQVTSIDTTMDAYVIAHNHLGCYSMALPMKINMLPGPHMLSGADGPTTFCGEGTVTLIAEGADSIRWSNGIVGSELFVDSAATYTATGIAENGCRGNSEPIEVIFVELPKVQMAIADDVMCISDEPVSLIALPVGGVFIGPGTEMYGMFNPFTAGGGTHEIYYTYADTTGCFGSSDTIQVEVMYHPTVIFATQDTMCIFDPSITLSGSPAGGLFEGDGVVGNIFTPQSSGTGPQNIIYSYVDSNGCTNIAQSVIYVDACTGTTEVSEHMQTINCFPNPANKSFVIQTNSKENFKAYLYSTNGSLVHSMNFSRSYTVNTEDLPSGIYELVLRGEQSIEKRLIAVQHL